jgi:hypothetical protein
MTTCSKIDDLRARSTCEQDRSVCVILHILSRGYGRIITFFWCINDDVICVCVILHLKRHACVIISVQYNFLYDLPTHLQAGRRTSRWGLANPCLFWYNMCVCVILHLKRHACVIISVQYNFFVWFTYSLATLEEQADGGWLIRVSFDVICSWFRISCPQQRRHRFVSPCLMSITKALVSCP